MTEAHRSKITSKLKCSSYNLRQHAYPSDHRCQQRVSTSLSVLPSKPPFILCSIGLAFVHAYAERGWSIIAAVRDPSKMPDIPGIKVIKIEVDSLTDAKSVSRIMPSLNFVFLISAHTTCL